MLAQILIVVIVAIAVTALAERRGLQPALLIASVGLAASFLPGLPPLELDPEIILGVMLPPLLFSAASDFSFVSFAQRLSSIVNLGVLLVFVTAGVVALVASWAVPSLPFAAALVLGAIVAPPDAVTAVAIGGRSGLPAGLMTVLKGESLINDAAALTLFAGAVAATAGTHAFIDSIPLSFLYTAVLGVALGLVIGHVAVLTRMRLSNPSLATVISVVVPFASYLVAEEVHASGVLAVVAAGFTLGHHAAEAGFKERIQERQFWRTVDTLLETFVFAYIGLQFRFVLGDALDAGLPAGGLMLAAAVLFALMVVVRLAWVFATAWIARRRYRLTMARVMVAKRQGGRNVRLLPPRPLTWKENVILSWTGMRGVVTLAAAAGIPLLTADGEPFPGREFILALALLVTVATLLIQGLTLPWLIRRLRPDDARGTTRAAQQRELAWRLAEEANLSTLAEYRATHRSLFSQWVADAVAERAIRPSAMDGRTHRVDRAEAFQLSQRLLAARRYRLLKARDERKLDDMVLREVLEEMDLQEAAMDGHGRRLDGV